MLSRCGMKKKADTVVEMPVKNSLSRTERSVEGLRSR